LEKRLTYERPELRKVRLDIKTSVLTVCNTSIVTTPMTPLGCKNDPTCYTAPPA
jgi:hypothetical protein